MILWTAVLAILLFSVADSGDVTKRSLVFVVDTTSSMGEDLKDISAGVSKMIQNHWFHVQHVFSNLVLVPFNDDPYTANVTNTTNEREFYKRIHNLRAYGGGDCPEKLLTGAVKGSKFALPHSLVIVFTDGLIKDKEKLLEFQKIAKSKKLNLMVVMSGCCHLNPCPVKSFKRIIKSTKGVMYRIAKESVKYILRFIIHALENDIGKLTNLPKDFNDLLLFISKKRRKQSKNGKSHEKNFPSIHQQAVNKCKERRLKDSTPQEIFLLGCNRIICTETSYKIVRERCDADPGHRKCMNLHSTWKCDEGGSQATCVCVRDALGPLVKVI